MNLCLGRLPKNTNSKVPFLRAMLDSKLVLPQPPVSTTNNLAVKDWPMLANDVAGDCVIAGSLHYYQCATANSNIEVIPDSSSAISDYSAVGQATAGAGYNPVTKENDNGLVIDQAVLYWMDKGLSINNTAPLNLLAGQARIDTNDKQILTLAIDIFCGVLVGVNLPITAQSEFYNNSPWGSTLASPGGWGGHCVYIVDYDPNWLYAITWGRVQKISWPWWNKYADEAVVILSRDLISQKTKQSPSHLTLASLDTEIENLRGSLGLQAYG